MSPSHNSTQTIAAADRLGGRPGDAPFDVSGVARMATIVDPHDRLVGLWQANGRSGVERQEQPGSMWWVEMLAHDVRGATHFYSSLFGWNASERPLSHLTRGYTVYSIGNESIGGAITIERNWGNVPERWQVLFAVTDLNRIIDQTHGLGGIDDLPVIEIPSVGTMRLASATIASGLFFRDAAFDVPKAGPYGKVRLKPDTTAASSSS